MVAKVIIKADGEAHIGEVDLVGNLFYWASQRKNLIFGGAVCLPEPQEVTFWGVPGVLVVLEIRE